MAIVIDFNMAATLTHLFHFIFSIIIVGAKMTTRKASNLRKKGGATIRIPEEIETIGSGDTGCIFRDAKTLQLYKMIIPQLGIPRELKAVEMLHRLPLDRDVFVYPDQYVEMSMDEVKPIIEKVTCKDIWATIEHFQPKHVYVAPMMYAGIDLIKLKEVSRTYEAFPKFTLQEVENILEQLQYIVLDLRKARLVHGDLHPGNITFTGWEGEPGHRTVKVHVIDFGLIREMKEDDEHDKVNDEHDVVYDVLPNLFVKDLVSKQVMDLRIKPSPPLMLANIFTKLRNASTSPESSSLSRKSSARSLAYVDMTPSPPRKIARQFDGSPVRRMFLGSPSPLRLNGLESASPKGTSKEIGGATKKKACVKKVQSS